MMHTRKKMSWIATAALGAALAVITSGCTTAAQTGGSEKEAIGDELAPSIYCGEECQAQLALEADPEEISGSVGVSWSSASFPYGAKSTTQIPKFIKKFFPNIDVTVSDGQGDATTQSGQVDNMVAQGIDVLIISPQDSAALADAVDRAKEAGVKVIAADRSVETKVDTYIGSDNVEAGEVAGQAIVETFPDGANVVELAGSLGASPTIDRGDGFRTAIEESNIKIIESQTANYDRAEGLKVMEDLLQRFGAGEIDAVFAHNDQMSFGAIQAINEAGRDGEIKVFGIDGEEGALDMIQDGTYTATVGYPLVVKESAIAAAKLCAGEDIDERIVLDSTLIDSSNVSEYLGHAPQ
ncbi:substrate-binding domain-containing protein [Paramicrobacterium agarici]|uniref:substrate-binding domain-containing protein n=1 Tax=Paramicrobacterium agarici TaxID=630514 RepID=UPI00114D844C|nr:substrate-binding domain-containing protein [Microbacterium agarici]